MLSASLLPSPAATPIADTLTVVNGNATLNGVGNGVGNGSTGTPTVPPGEPEPEPDQARVREQVERILLRLSQDLYEMEICAGDVVAGQEDRIAGYLKEVNKSFVELDGLSREMTDTVPRPIIDYIDRHRNPHVYSKNTLSRAVGENQYALGRVLGLESFRRQLASAVKSEFPMIPLPERRHQPESDVAESIKKEEGLSPADPGTRL